MSEYAQNLIRRAFQVKEVRELKMSEITRFVQNRISSEDRYAALTAMRESGELSRHFVEPLEARRACTLFRQERIISPVPLQNDGRKIKPSGAAQRRTKLARELIAAGREQVAALKETTILIRQLTETLRNPQLAEKLREKLRD